MTDHDVWDEGPPITSLFHPDNDRHMPMGWPRPRDPGGLPVPYIAADVFQLGVVEPMRQFLCVSERRCQVCGDPLGDTCVVVAGPGNTQLVIDGAGIHPHPCWTVARRRCPQMAKLADDGTLRVWTIRVDDLVVEDGAGHLIPGYRVPTAEPDQPAPASIEAATPSA